MRSNATVIVFNKSKVSDEIYEGLITPDSNGQKYDIEQDGNDGKWKFYSHNVDKKYKRMQRDLLALFPAVLGVENRAKGGTDHLDMFIEVQDEEQADHNTENGMYKNVRLSEVLAGVYNITDLEFLSEI